MAFSPQLTRSQLTQYLTESDVVLEQCYGQQKEAYRPYYYCKLCGTNVISASTNQATCEKTEKFKSHLAKCSILSNVREQKLDLKVCLNVLPSSPSQSENLEITKLPTFGDQLKILIETLKENGLNLEQMRQFFVKSPGATQAICKLCYSKFCTYLKQKMSGKRFFNIFLLLSTKQIWICF